ncbi:MAG: NACHT domain-containing protein [Rhizonema sp. PD37]|nr:NACHT domain-containing protein [Rhizonema sp. PD37]
MTGIASPIIKDKLQRSEIVIKLLKQFNLAPEHPPADFSGVYAYTLVEYGIGKPKPILELFRQEPIKKAFRKAFDHNNPSILLSEVDTFIDGYALGDQIKSLGIDVRREIAAFYVVFSEVAKRSRTPAEVLTNQAIASLHQKIATITLTLDRLPTLEGIRTEIARLTSQSYPALSEGSNQCRAISLAEQMRGWFETLGYRFEKHEVWEEEYFEWIINIQGRRGYDRILVRGIEGEAGVKNVAALRDQIQKQRTDEGWLVSARRISRAARELVKQEDYSKVFCYTFDEIIDQDADFSNYFDWLETEVKRRGIDTKYVPLACTKEEIDSVTKRRIAVSRYEQEDGWIDGYIDLWLDDPAKEHISVLGEFGTGKTWFVFHYAWNALQSYRDAQKRGVERLRLPLVITLRDYAKALNVENVLAGFFFTQHNIRLNSDVFDQLNRMGKLLLIFDGFDEMAAKVDRQQMINNFWELAKVVVPGSKVILTCRTEHFPEAKEGRELLNAELLASTANLTGETPQFEVLELEKFNDNQIRQVLSHQAEAETVEQVMGNPQLLDLARRPVMTELILEALPDIEVGKPVDMSRVYLYAVRRKMERDIKAERTFTSLADKLYFLCELSWEMLSTNQMSLNYRLFPERIRRLFGSVVQEEKDLDHWHYDMMGQTMLIRNAEGDYTPAHRSLLEFFVAYKFAAELGALTEDFTELAREQSCLDKSTAPFNYTWSIYFASRSALAPLKAFTSEPLEKLRETFGRSPLTKAVMDLLLPMLADSQRIINVIEAIRGKTEDEVGYVGGNAATLVVKADKAALEGKHLCCSVIKAADFTNASLRHTNFVEANLRDSVFTKILGSVWSVAFSPNGIVWATGDSDGIVRLWEVDSGSELSAYKEHTSWIYSVAFSPDNQTLASSSGDQTVRLWNILTGKCLKTLQGHTKSVRTVAFSPNGKIIASGSADTTVRLWDIRTGECITVLQRHTGRVRAIAFHPNGQTLASGSADTTVRLWDIRTGECIKVLQGHTGDVRSIIFSSNGQIIASGANDQTVKLWNVNTGQCLKTLQEHMGWVNSIAFHPEGQILASAGNQTVKLWNISTGQCIRTLQEHMGWVSSIAFHPEGQILVSASDKMVKLWNISTGQCLKNIQGHTHWVNSIAFHPEGKILASAGDDAKVKLWDICTSQCLTILQGHVGWVRSVVFSFSGETLASVSDDQTVRLWNVPSGQCMKVLQGHTDTVRTIAFCWDGSKLATGSYDQTIRLWNTHTGECLQILKGHYDSVCSIAFSRDNRILASADSEKIVKLWDPKTGECLQILQGHHNSARVVTFSPNSKILASGGDDQTIRLWNIHTGECLKTLRGHHNWVRAIVFSPDGKTLASGSHDQTVRLWDVETGECIKALQRHTGWVRTVAFSPNGTTLGSGGVDGTIQLWDAKTGECVKTLVDEKPYKDMNITGVKGLTEAVKATLKALGAVENK